MEFVYGTVLMVIAIALLGFARFVVSRYEASSWVGRFAATETMALVITMVTAFGVAFLCAGVASDKGALGLTELGASLGVIVLAVIGVVRVFRVAGRRQPSIAGPAKPAPRPAASSPTASRPPA